MIYITGDTHQNATQEMQKFNTANFPSQNKLTKSDYIIIAGDFGFIWSNPPTNTELHWLKWLDEKPWITLFIDGNHENHDLLNNYPVSEWNGGKVHFITPSIIHLMRGQVYNIDNQIITTMGGAPSHDIQDGILDPADYSSKAELKQACRNLENKCGGWQYALYRIKGINWWESEIPTAAEYEEWDKNLAKYNYKVDYVITHEAPSSTVPFVSIYSATDMSKKLQQFHEKIDFKKWYFGHYHLDKNINDKDIVVYNDLIPLPSFSFDLF